MITMQSSWNNHLQFSGSMQNTAGFQQELIANQERNGKLKLNNISTEIELRQASFSYGQEKILENVNLIIPKHETLAIIGDSGSGKTTLLNMLSGLLRPDKGLFLVDGRDSADIDNGSYQKRIGYITQEPVIFNDSIFNNVTFWDEPSETNKLRYREALKKASIDQFVDHLPKGDTTILGTNGINLSGGQRQRIAIARELYKDIDILILDEATSSLDSETEKTIHKSIDALKGQYTIIIVAHRLSTLRNADRVAVLKNKTIETMGTYDEMIQEELNLVKESGSGQ